MSLPLYGFATSQYENFPRMGRPVCIGDLFSTFYGNHIRALG